MSIISFKNAFVGRPRTEKSLPKGPDRFRFATESDWLSWTWVHSEALPPEKSGGEPSFDLLTPRFLAAKFFRLWSGGQFWCNAYDHKFSKYDGMEAMDFFTLCSLIRFWSCHSNLLSPCVLFVTPTNTTKFAMVANPAMPAYLAATSCGEKTGMHYGSRIVCLSPYLKSIILF